MLVFPSSNEPGLEVVHALSKSNKVTLLGGSSGDPELDPSHALLREHLRCPHLEDPDFRPEFETLLSRHEVDLLFPTVDAVVAEIAGWELPSTRMIAPNAATARLLMSKRGTYRALGDALPVPEIYDGDDVAFPAFAKPDQGSGSRQAMLVSTQAQLTMARESALLVHEFLPGPEFTVDCINDLEGNLLASSPRLRARVGRGISLSTGAVESPQLQDHVRAISRVLRIEGPWFAQFKESRDGALKLLEVNARISGSMVLTRLSGINIPLVAVFLFTGWPVRIPARRRGVRINRFLRTVGTVEHFDCVIWDLEDTIVRGDGRADPDAVSRLYDLHNRQIRQILLTRHAAPRELLRAIHVPDLFEDVRSVANKPDGLASILADHALDAARCVFVNDSMTENLLIQDLYPALRILQPDSLDALSIEKIG